MEQRREGEPKNEKNGNKYEKPKMKKIKWEKKENKPGVSLISGW